jgi:hypothetical protein
MRFILSIVVLVALVAPVWADFAAGEKAFVERDFDTAWKELYPLAQNGDARAMEAVGCMYLDGYGVKQDNSQALIWFQKAVEKGNFDANNNLGFMYTQGIGVSVDNVKAFQCYLIAAKNDNYMAQATIAALYVAGIGVAADPGKALKWFLIVRENPDADSEIKATAETKIREIEKNMGPEIISQARAEAKSYRKFVEKKPIDIEKIPD